MTQQSAPEPTPSPSRQTRRAPTGTAGTSRPDTSSSSVPTASPSARSRPRRRSGGRGATTSRGRADRPRRAAGQGDADRQHDPPAARGGEGGAARRRQPQPAQGDPPASIKELETGLAPELVEELERLSLPFTEDETPSDAELRIAQAQLVGWLEGLFHGIQTAIYAQQMAARAQFEQMRRALPPGVRSPPGQPGHARRPRQPTVSRATDADQQPGTGGMYL